MGAEFNKKKTIVSSEKKNNEENMVNHLVASLNAIVIEGFIYRFDKVFNAAFFPLTCFKLLGHQSLL